MYHVLLLFQDKTILLFLSVAANLLITSSKDKLSASRRSIESVAKLIKRSSDIVERRYDLMRFSAENDRSHSAVLTTIVSASCSNLTRFGKADFSGAISRSTSLMVSSSLSARVQLASQYPVDSKSIPSCNLLGTCLVWRGLRGATSMPKMKQIL